MYDKSDNLELLGCLLGTKCMQRCEKYSSQITYQFLPKIPLHVLFSNGDKNPK